uniref:Uncharacterized protein n=1 Tax=Tanacetum cinerariifolium TaxID=118510 RepID=A0A699KWW3_TANCI|nr:hypothetical protein [Tanacetum cinerariifolium]
MLYTSFRLTHLIHMGAYTSVLILPFTLNDRRLYSQPPIPSIEQYIPSHRHLQFLSSVPSSEFRLLALKIPPSGSALDWTTNMGINL